MPTDAYKPRIFISYAHADEPEKPAEGEVKWLSFVTGYLRPAVKQGAVEIRIDRLMRGGDPWDKGIERKLRECDIFILLVSRNSLSSDYVVDKEIAIIRERQAKGEAVHFYPLVLTPTPNIGLDLVRDMNLRPREGKPLFDYQINERYRHMNEVANEIAGIAAKIARSKLSRGDEEISDGDSLTAWIAIHGARTGQLLGVRSSLRILPIATSLLHEEIDKSRAKEILDTACAVFRASALAWALTRYSFNPPNRNDLVISAFGAFGSAFQAADPAIKDAASAIIAARQSVDEARAAALERARGLSLAATARSGVTVAYAATATSLGVLTLPEDFRRIALASEYAYQAILFTEQSKETLKTITSKAWSTAEEAWIAVRADAALVTAGPDAFTDSPIWPNGTPNWVRGLWSRLQEVLPDGQDWDVWIDWYERRLGGESRGEGYELVFASVPQEEWDKGPAAANAWIKAHLPKPAQAPPSAELPAPLSNLAAPFSYSWNASLRVAVVAGAQNLPFYPHFKSEEEHRHTLEACRLGAERLLKSLRDRRYNARPEYGEALEYYLDDLPRTAGAGNIVLANDQVRILHAMFLADANLLPEGFASRLKSVIANQFALNAFYDVVQRHNEAVNAGNWTEPFPFDAAKSFFGAVENTPRFFEREVGEGLRRVEEAAPPPATESLPALSAAIQPPPLPPGTPNAERSHERQMATAANALWDAFLKGQDLPLDKQAWRAAAEKLGANVRPLLDFLRTLDAPKG